MVFSTGVFLTIYYNIIYINCQIHTDKKGSIKKVKRIYIN